jgi:hypothetical protein
MMKDNKKYAIDEFGPLKKGPLLFIRVVISILESLKKMFSRKSK